MKKHFSTLPASFTAAAIATIVFTAGEHYAFAAVSTARHLLRYIAFVVIASSGWMIRRLVAALVQASGTSSKLGLQPSRSADISALSMFLNLHPFHYS